MTTSPGGKPGSGSEPGRVAAETPQSSGRLVVRGDGDSKIGAHDTAVAANSRSSDTNMETPAAGMVGLTGEIVGTTLSNRYLVTRKVGQGGMGAVYEATHTLIGKRVAVKVLLEKYAKRESIVKRLEKEAQLASSVGNEHIIDITDIGTTEDGRTFVVMEYLEGESLAECLARDQRLPEQRILRIIAQAASALGAAHAKGIVHRDIKPENLFLLRRKDRDFVKVVDFGISKSLRASGEEEEQPRLTQTGMVLGTPLYMSPEQARGEETLDARVDIYALGVIMYEAATGQVPFVGANYLSVISQVLNETAKSPRELRPELSEEFEAIVQRAMERDRVDRYASAEELLNDVNALLDDPTHSTERARISGPRRKPAKSSASSVRYVVWIAGIAVVVAAVAFTVKMMMGGGKSEPAVADAAVAKPVVVDAAAVAPPVDAELFVEMDIVTVPPGARILQDGALATGIDGKQETPMRISVLRKDKEISFIAQLDGYDELPFKKNPLEYAEHPSPITVTLTKAKKPPKWTPPRPPPPTGNGSGSATKPAGGGDLGGYPPEGGTVPKK